MREIKFRGKEIGGEWVYGDLLRENDNRFGGQFFKIYVDTNDVEYEGVLIRVDGSTIGQYTGLKDKNGVEIYEGDILSYDDGSEKIQIVYNGNAFEGYRLDRKIFFHNNYLQNKNYMQFNVIGNIHSHPELLK